MKFYLPFAQALSRTPRTFLATLGVGALFLSACQQQDPAVVNDLVVTTAEKERLSGELEKARAEIQNLKQQLASATSAAEAATKEIEKGIDKKMVQRSFIEAVTELQSKMEERYPSEKVVSYQIYDVNFPSENPISSSVSFVMNREDGSERVLSFEGAANTEGVWNFAPVKSIVKRESVAKAPPNPPPPPAQPASPARPTQSGEVTRMPSTQPSSSGGRVITIEWPD